MITKPIVESCPNRLIVAFGEDPSITVNISVVLIDHVWHVGAL
jgi:hypothetical protein